MGEPRGTATVLMSGGIDSAACAHLFRSRGHTTQGLFVDYGQQASVPEKRAVFALSTALAIPILELKLLGFGDAFGAGEIVGRNALLVFSALTQTRGNSGVLALGIHAGTPYYDCSPAFFRSLSQFVSEHTDGRVVVSAPFLDWTKKDIFDYFIASGLPVEATYSCEAGSEPPCGACASCGDRSALGC